ncbi:unnamed protein product, partial [Prorocentrum cordatum]
AEAVPSAPTPAERSRASAGAEGPAAPTVSLPSPREAADERLPGDARPPRELSEDSPGQRAGAPDGGRWPSPQWQARTPGREAPTPGAGAGPPVREAAALGAGVGPLETPSIVDEDVAECAQERHPFPRSPAGSEPAANDGPAHALAAARADPVELDSLGDAEERRSSASSSSPPCSQLSALSSSF